MMMSPNKVLIAGLIAAACSWQVLAQATERAEADAAPLADDAPRFTRARARYEKGSFRVTFEVSERVRRTNGFIIVELDYLPTRGGRATPRSATAIDQVSWTNLGNGTLQATLTVSGPAPKDPESVQARVSSAPTPHP
ncbi:MAG: hypothetical protein KC731_22125 [Myxococcales bacterium]|nr:hypothetical protein [Myxococcales bacterium]